MRIGSQQRHGQHSALEIVVGVQNREDGVRELLLLFEAQGGLPALQVEGLDQPPTAACRQSSDFQVLEELHPLLRLPIQGGLVQDLFSVVPGQRSSGRLGVQLLARAQSG